MNRRRTCSLFTAGVALMFAAACAPSRTIERVDPSRTADLSYRFDEDDARDTAYDMIDDALSHPWLTTWSAQHDQRPIVIIGYVQNDTSDYIDTRLFTKQFERAMINSGRVRIVAEPEARQEIRDERRQGQKFNRKETVKKLAHELGADFMLIGRVGENVEISPGGRQRIQYYQVDLELIDIESNEKVWIGERQIEKRVHN